MFGFLLQTSGHLFERLLNLSRERELMCSIERKEWDAQQCGCKVWLMLSSSGCSGTP